MLRLARLVVSLVLALGGALDAGDLFPRGRAAIADAGPTPALPSTSARACGRCHPSELAEWRASAHATAFTDPLFASSYRRTHRRWCLGCHAPLVEQVRALGGEAGASLGADVDSPSEGVSCAACHVRDGRVLAARPPSDAARAAHPITVAPLDDPALCGGCHDFPFPARDGRSPVAYTDEPMQRTLGEWRASPSARAGATCQDCHLGAFGHRMPGGHDASLLARTLSTVVTLSAGGASARVTVTARGAGHAVPTGDPFRRLRVLLCPVDDATCDEPLAEATFARTFRDASDPLRDAAPLWRLASDTTLVPGDGGIAARTIELPLPAPARAIAWRTLYSYAAPSTEPDLPREAVEHEIARGVATRPQ